MTTITKNMVKPEYDTLKARKLRMHDLHSIKAMHPDIHIRAAAAFLIKDEEATPRCPPALMKSPD